MCLARSLYQQWGRWGAEGTAVWDHRHALQTCHPPSFSDYRPAWGRKRAQRVRIRFWSLTAWVQIPTLPLTVRVPWSELFVPCNSALSPAQQSESRIRKNWVSWEEPCLEQCLTQWALTECLLSWWPLILFFQDPQVLQSGAPFLGCSGGCCAVAQGEEGKMELEILAGEAALQPLIAASHIYDWLITLPITFFFSHWEGK